MKQKPLLFIIIAIAHLIEPLIKLLYFKFTTPFGFGKIINNVSQIQGPVEFFEFWLLFPIGGLALLGVKKWSYPIFVMVQIYNIASHLLYKSYTWPYVSKTPFLSAIALLFINTLIIVYFALPDVRRPFFDKKLRWWESRTRYQLHMPISISLNNPDIYHNVEILNISQSGAFINYKGVIENGQILNLNISYKQFNIHLKGVKVSDHSFHGEKGVGIKFKFENIWENLYVRKLVKQVAKDSKAQNKVPLAA